MAEERRVETGPAVEVAYAKDRIEAEMIQGLLESGGVPSALQARALLADTLIEAAQDAMQQAGDADFLEDGGGRKPRSYGLVGGYARIYLWSFGIMALAFGVFLLLRGG